MNLSIRKVPDPVLRAVCAEVTAFGPDLAALAKAMLAAMYEARGRGLAAPQIGLAQRIFVMDTGWKEATPTPLVLINPVISSRSQETAIAEESCLSIPGVTCHVERPVAVSVRWQGLDGSGHEETFKDFAARCIQHETDHLDGILCTDRAR